MQYILFIASTITENKQCQLEGRALKLLLYDQRQTINGFSEIYYITVKVDCWWIYNHSHGFNLLMSSAIQSGEIVAGIES